MTLTIEFLNRYYKLPEFQAYYSVSGKKEWYLSKEEIAEYVSAGEDEIDFLWCAIIFNLFSKTVYFYSPENYKYCNDFLEWKYGLNNVLYKIYIGKFKNLIDEKCKFISSELNGKFYELSKNKIDIYSLYFLNIYELIFSECCDVNHKSLISNVVENSFFKEEFSNRENDLSHIFFKSLLKNVLEYIS